jgi:membrane protease YdiL (CAAX protease family)
VLGRGGGADILRVTWGVLAIITVAALIAVRLLDRRPVSQLGIVPGPGYWGDLGFGLVMGALLMTVVFGAELWAGWVRIVGFRYSRSASESFAAASLYVALAFVAVAFYEELANRGYLLRTLAQGLAGRRLSPAAALLTASLLSSLLFGLGHAGNPHATFVSTFNIALTGVLLSLPYILTGRLAASIGMHATWNFFQGVVYGFPVSGLATPARLLVIEQGGPPLWTGADFGPEAGLVGLFACVLGTALIVWRERRRRGSLTLCADLVDGAGMAAGGGSPSAVDANERPLDDISSREEGFGQIQ